MKKVDLIKFRCTPEFKARVAREATYRGKTLSEFVEGAIENELRAQSVTGGYVFPAGDRVFVDGEQAKVVATPITPAPVKAGCPANGKPCNCTGACQRPVGPNLNLDTGIKGPILTAPSSGTVLTSPSTCPHGRPPAACWECA